MKKTITKLTLASILGIASLSADITYTGETNTIKYSDNLVYAVTTTFLPGSGYALRTSTFRGQSRGWITLNFGRVTDAYGNILGECTFDDNYECVLDNSHSITDPYHDPQEYYLGNITLVAEFVDRFYRKILSRPSDDAGLYDWVMKLRLKEKTASDVAKGFIFSDEFTDKNTTDAEYVDVLYSAFFDRPADSEGFRGWLNALEEGKTREEVLDGFLGSKEFLDLAAAADIEATSLISSTDSNLSDLEKFVARFYEKILGRTADKVGLDSWVTQLKNGEKTASDIAKGFIFSPEFVSKELNDYYFVEVLYVAFFDRRASNEGSGYWYTKLQNGVTREAVVNGFLNSQEFANLAKKYGITVN